MQPSEHTGHILRVTLCSSCIVSTLTDNPLTAYCQL